MSTASSGLAPAAHDPDLASVRPRNRRLISTADTTLSSPNSSPTRGVSPIPAARIGSVTGRNNIGGKVAGAGSSARPLGPGLLEGSWIQGWSSIQQFATSLLAGGESAYDSGSDRPGSRNGSRTRKPHPGYNSRSDGRRDTWGPEPPDSSRPRLEGRRCGLAGHGDAKLKAMRTASILESHEGVNGGLDTTGNFKKRTSDEDLRGLGPRSGSRGTARLHTPRSEIRHLRRDCA